MSEPTRTHPPDAPEGATRSFGTPDATGTFHGAPRASSGPPPVVPGYELFEEVGAGGMGRVYRARQASTGRVVAIKVIIAGELASPAARARFRAEIEATAKVSHPHVVQVFEAGEADGRAFLVCEFVPGGSLSARLDGTPWDAKRAAELLLPLVRGAAHAHAAGIVHRDLKPSNVLLTADGTPKIADFGVAKQLGTGSETNTGAVLGTPSYMPPEQATSSKVVGPTADVYALGAIFYELLTGRPPFKGADFLDTLDLVRTQEPVPPRVLQPKVPRDAETVCLKCLQKDPAKRYATAADLADDLERFLANRPIVARPVGSLERGWRWCRRNPAVAGLLAALLLVFVGGSAVAWVLAARAEYARRSANDEQQKAADARDEAEDLLYAGRVYQANVAANEFRTARLVQLLDDARPKPGEKDRRGWEWHYLHRLTHTWSAESELELGTPAQPGGLWAWTFSPDRTRAVVAGVGDFGAEHVPFGVFDTTTGRRVRDLAELRGDGAWAHVPALHPSPAVASDFTFAARPEWVVLEGPRGPGAVGPGAPVFRHRVTLHDLRGAEPRPPETVFEELDGHVVLYVGTGGARVVAVVLDDLSARVGPRVQPRIEVWERAAPAPRRTTIPLPNTDPYVATVAPDARTAVVSGTDAADGGKGAPAVRWVELCDLTAQPVGRRRLTSGTGVSDYSASAQYSAGGTALAVFEPGAVLVYDPRTGAQLGRWSVPSETSNRFLFPTVSDDGRRAAFIGAGGTVVVGTRAGDASAPNGGAFAIPDRDPNGVWRTSTFRQPIGANALFNTGVALTGDGRRLVVAHGTKCRHWNLTADGEFAAEWPEAARIEKDTALALPSARGRFVLYAVNGTGDGQKAQPYRFQVRDPRRAEPLGDVRGHGYNPSGFLSPDGRRVLVWDFGPNGGAASRGALRAVEAPDKELATFRDLMAFSPCGRWVHTSLEVYGFLTDDLRAVQVCRADDGRRACEIPAGEGEVVAGAWVTPADVLAVATHPKRAKESAAPVALTVRFYDAATGAARASWTGPAVWGLVGVPGENVPHHTVWQQRAVPSADGRKLAVSHVGTDGAARVWVLDTATGAVDAECAAPPTGRTVDPAVPIWQIRESSGVVVGPNGSTAVWAGADVVTWARPGAPPVRLTGHQVVRAVALSDDGRRAFTVDAPLDNQEAVLRVWDALRGNELLTIRFPSRLNAGFTGLSPKEMWFEGERLHVLTHYGVRVFNGTPLEK